MKTRSMAILSVIVALGVGVQPSAQQPPAPPQPLWFDGGPPPGTAPNLAGLVPITPFDPGATATTLIGGNNAIYLYDSLTGTLSLPPLQVYSGPNAPVNFAVTHISGRTVLWTAPGGPSNNPLAAFVWGPPHSLLGDFGMIDGGGEFGVNVAAGDVIADPMPELFYTTATGGSGEVFKVSPGIDSYLRFRPIAGYEGAFRLATGDINKDGYDELAVSPVARPDVHFFTFRDSGPVFVGRVTPFPGTTNGPFVDLFDVNNDGRDEIFFGSPGGSGGGQARAMILSYVDRDYLDLLADFPAPEAGSAGVAVTGTVINGRPAVITAPQSDARAQAAVRIFSPELHVELFRSFSSAPFGDTQTPTDLFIEAFFPPRR